MEEWGHFVAASRKIGNFDKWVVIWGVEVKDVGKVESKKISLKFGENIGKVTISNSKPISLIHCNRQVKLRIVFLFNFGKLEFTFCLLLGLIGDMVGLTDQWKEDIFPQMPLLLFL